MELLLQKSEASLGGFAVARAQAQDEAVDSGAQVMQPRLGIARGRLVGGDLDPALQQVEGRGQPIHVER